ncbi:MAG: ERF family protein [Chloroflexi bacterium]|nr:ERF family protein [Chloroflexota bacterium]
MNKVAKTEQSTTVHTSLHEAISAVQGELKNPEKNKEADAGKYKYKYADIGDVLEAVLPVLSRHGLYLTQPTQVIDNNVWLRTVITHVKGDSVESVYPVCSINGNHQAMGSALTYARRYALTSLIGVAAVDDTDGEGAAPAGEGPRKQMSAHQAKKELDWEKIQTDIDDSPDFSRLTKWDAHLDSKKGDWPNSFLSSARERILKRRLELATVQMKKAETLDALNDEFTDVEAALENKVHWDDLAAIHSKLEENFS